MGSEKTNPARGEAAGLGNRHLLGGDDTSRDNRSPTKKQQQAQHADADYFGLGALTELALASNARRDLLAECGEQLIAETAALLRSCRWDDDELIVEQFRCLDTVFRTAKITALEIRDTLPAPVVKGADPATEGAP
jgi:hypothetical protein